MENKGYEEHKKFAEIIQRKFTEYKLMRVSANLQTNIYTERDSGTISEFTLDIDSTISHAKVLYMIKMFREHGYITRGIPVVGEFTISYVFYRCVSDNVSLLKGK